jgi:peptidyl-prolyl cis-trans isomerase B (cyclophilin B)
VRTARRTLLAPTLALALALTACGGGDDEAAEPAPEGGTPAGTDEPEALDAAGVEVGDCRYVPDGREAARDVDPPSEEDLVAAGPLAATITTSAGVIPLQLDVEGAPCTVASFRSLAAQDYFDDTTCHRLTLQGIFVLQCGDPTGTGRGGPGYSFADENTEGATYSRGTVAMANAGPDTNGSQFFLVYDESPLPPDYSVFGTIDEAGLDVLDSIAELGTETAAPEGAPATPVEISDVVVE